MHTNVKHLVGLAQDTYSHAVGLVMSAKQVKTLAKALLVHGVALHRTLRLGTISRCQGFSSQRGLPATYLIPGCVGRGVRLESVRPAAALTATGNLGIQKNKK